MTIATQQAFQTFLGNGVVTSFNFNFVADEAADIQVIYTNANGTQTVLTTSQYTLTINSPAVGQLWGVGGTVVYPITGTPIANGTSLTVQRVIPEQQLVTILDQGDFSSQVIEQALDILEMQIQQVSARTGQFRGTWSTGVTYNFGDIVVDGVNGTNTTNWYMCINANVSGTWANDLANGDWQLALNLQSITNPGAGVAGGDLTGNYPNPTIAKIQGIAVSGVTGTGNAVLSNSPTLNSPTLVSAVVGTATAGTTNTQAASNAFAQNAASTLGNGYSNKFRNPGMDIWQRGTVTVTTGTPLYTADGWIVGTTGATATVAQSSSFPQNGALNSLQITGNTSMTDTFLRQRIESSVAQGLAINGNTSGNVTVQFAISNQSGAAITPTLTVKIPTATDNYSTTTTLINAVSLQTINSASAGVVSYTFGLGASAIANGMEVTIDFGAALNANTKNIYISAADIRGTPGVTVGANSNPPVPELRPIGSEMPINQRYFFSLSRTGGISQMCLGQCYSTTAALILVNFPTSMRSSPSFTSTAASTFSITDAASNAKAITGLTASTLSTTTAELNATGATGVVAGNATFFESGSSTTATINFSAEI